MSDQKAKTLLDSSMESDDILAANKPAASSSSSSSSSLSSLPLHKSETDVVAIRRWRGDCNVCGSDYMSPDCTHLCPGCNAKHRWYVVKDNDENMDHVSACEVLSKFNCNALLHLHLSKIDEAQYTWTTIDDKRPDVDDCDSDSDNDNERNKWESVLVKQQRAALAEAQKCYDRKEWTKAIEQLALVPTHLMTAESWQILAHCYSMCHENVGNYIALAGVDLVTGMQLQDQGAIDCCNRSNVYLKLALYELARRNSDSDTVNPPASDLAKALVTSRTQTESPSKKRKVNPSTEAVAESTATSDNVQVASAQSPKPRTRKNIQTVANELCAKFKLPQAKLNAEEQKQILHSDCGAKSEELFALALAADGKDTAATTNVSAQLAEKMETLKKLGKATRNASYNIVVICALAMAMRALKHIYGFGIRNGKTFSQYAETNLQSNADRTTRLLTLAELVKQCQGMRWANPKIIQVSLLNKCASKLQTLMTDNDKLLWLEG